MFAKYFPFVSLGSFPATDVLAKRTHKFRFKSQYDYLVDVEEYQHSLYMLKFYLKNHRMSEHKFSLRSNEHKANEVLGTCLQIAKYIYDRDKIASFGFIGANDLNESKSNTKRYRVYQAIAIRFFDSATFQHFNEEANSLYFILNKNNNNISKEIISEQLLEHYDIFL